MTKMLYHFIHLQKDGSKGPPSEAMIFLNSFPDTVPPAAPRCASIQNIPTSLEYFPTHNPLQSSQESSLHQLAA